MNKFDKLGQYTISVLSVFDYYKYQVKRHGIKKLLTLTDSGYPRIFAWGVCYYSTQEIVVAQIGNWQQRVHHEIGHSFGRVHTWKPGCIMHPWGLLRGDKL